MSDFETWLKDARDSLSKGSVAICLSDVVCALEALAAERAAERMTPRFEGPVEALRGPRSYSHGGMH